MSVFECKVLTPQEQMVIVKIKSDDKISALKKLKRNGMTTISIKEIQFNSFVAKDEDKKVNATIYSKSKEKNKKNNIHISNFSRHISLKELQDFTNDLYLLRTSNFSTEQALKIICANIDNKYFNKCIRKMLKNIENDDFMYKVMRDYLNVFPQVYINLIRSGELSGDINESLYRAINYLSSQEKTINKIKDELIPSIYIFVGIVFFTIISLCVGIPTLNNMILSNGSTVIIPKIVVISDRIIRFLASYWFLWIAIIFVVILAIKYYYSTFSGKLKIDKYKYTNRFNGKIMYYFDFSRTIRTIFTNLNNNMRIQDAIEMSKSSTQNTYFLTKLESAINNVYIGKSWIEPFEKDKLVDPIIVEMLKRSVTSKSNMIIDNTISYIENSMQKEIDKLIKKLPIYSHIIVGIALFLFLILVLIPTINMYLSGFLLID